MNEPLRDFVACIGQGCDAWRRGDDDKGLELFQQACLIWLDELTYETDDETERRAILYGRLAGWLPRMLELLEGGDIIAATDALEYGLLPELAELRAAMTAERG
ncbi:hypothetical protein ACFFNY_17810 [Paenibacillus hodogayensis]|uniref:Uncharacterized protein n=1 Tax=Paenibacillus hodogayensis TaxID=279208 RepID=A0ABV5VZ67_9BACL